MHSEELESKKVYKKIFDCSPEAMLIIDPKGKILRANKRVTDWLGYEIKEVEDKNMANIKFLTMASKAKVLKKFAQRMLGKNIDPYDLTFIDKQGREFIGLISAVPVQDEQGKIIFDFAIISNVTKQRQAEVQLKEHSKEVERMNRLMIGRELEMKKLKEKIIELEKGKIVESDSNRKGQINNCQNSNNQGLKKVTITDNKIGKEVTEQTKNLVDLNKLMIGRELKMMELKKEIIELKKRLQDNN